MEYSLEPSRTFEFEGNAYAEFVVEYPKGSFDIRIDVEMKLFRADLLTARKNPQPGTEADTARFMQAEKYIESEEAAIVAAAQNIPGNDEIATVENIYRFVLKALRYNGYNPDDVGASATLRSGKGDCTDYSDLFVALCRAKGIPARIVEGYTVNASSDTPKHDWVEVYFKDYGWVPFDVLWGDLGKAAFDALPTKYITLSRIRNDTGVDNYHYWSFRYWGDPIACNAAFEVK